MFDNIILRYRIVLFLSVESAVAEVHKDAAKW